MVIGTVCIVGGLPHVQPGNFGQSTEDMEYELASRTGRIDLLGQAPESDAPLLQRGHRLNQLLEPSAQAVELPHHQSVAGTHILQSLGQPGALLRRPFRAADRIRENPFTPRYQQSILLKGQSLFLGRNPSKADEHSKLPVPIATRINATLIASWRPWGPGLQYGRGHHSSSILYRRPLMDAI